MSGNHLILVYADAGCLSGGAPILRGAAPHSGRRGRPVGQTLTQEPANA